MSEHSGKSGTGIGFLGLLTLLFIALKLTHFIAWSWWLVLMPLWLSCLMGVFVILAVLTVAIISKACKKY